MSDATNPFSPRGPASSGVSLGERLRSAAREINTLKAERDALLVALHDAINRPKGVVPASADRFYDPHRFYDAPPAAMKDGG